MKIIFLAFLIFSNFSFSQENASNLTIGKDPENISHGANINQIHQLLNDSSGIRGNDELKKRPLSDNNNSTRSAIDANLFKVISPSVVLIFNKEKDGFTTGSGSLIDSNGTILTNYHVIEGHTEVGVYFKPEKDYQQIQDSDFRKATVIKVDQVADLALLKVSSIPGKKNPIKLGDISDIAVGTDVHAIGHPEGQVWSYTKGVISQYRIGFKWFNNQADVIQTQTPINPGNSGGPLLNDRGLLIGVNSFVRKGSEGLNFAVSIDDVKKFLSRSGDRFNKSEKKEKKATAEDILGPKPKCEGKVLFRGKNADGTAEMISIDTECNGKINAQYIYPFDTSKPYRFEMDSNYDHKVDMEAFSYKRNNQWDISFWDNNFDGVYDVVGIHADGTLTPTSFISYDEYQANLKNNSRQQVAYDTPQDTRFHGYGSVFFDDAATGGVFGWSLGYQTALEAENAASNICYKRGAKGTCKKMLTKATKCISIAQNDKWIQSGYGSNQSSSDNMALNECNKHGGGCYIPNEGSACNTKW
jgi:S1-C subfamily serine protease